MGRILTSIAISLGAHVLLGLSLLVYLEYVPRPTVMALELSSVELSFSEVVAESSPVAALPVPAPPPEPVESEQKEAPQPEMPPPVPEETPTPVVEREKPEKESPKLEKQVQAPEPQPTAVPTPPTPAPRQAKIDAPPRPQRTIRPDYPKGARMRGEQGNVVLELLVNEEGMVDRADVVESSGFTELDEAALQAVCTAKFSPARSGRKAVSTTARLTLVFRLK